MHYHYSTGKPCNCTFYKPDPEDQETDVTRNIPRHEALWPYADKDDGNDKQKQQMWTTDDLE